MDLGQQAHSAESNEERGDRLQTEHEREIILRVRYEHPGPVSPRDIYATGQAARFNLFRPYSLPPALHEGFAPLPTETIELLLRTIVNIDQHRAVLARIWQLEAENVRLLPERHDVPIPFVATRHWLYLQFFSRSARSCSSSASRQ